ncbi:Dephospho-CoA kinase,P-loop containing nucleoside triphosphate hydrolase, partial [Cinara cedri]
KLRFFLAQERRVGREFLILDIPLLLETKFHSDCNFIIFVHANRLIQNQRLSRRNVDEKKLTLMCSSQLSLRLKRKLSNFTINTGVNKGYVFSQVKEVLAVAKTANFSTSC